MPTPTESLVQITLLDILCDKDFQRLQHLILLHYVTTLLHYVVTTLLDIPCDEDIQCLKHVGPGQFHPPVMLRLLL